MKAIFSSNYILYIEKLHNNPQWKKALESCSRIPGQDMRILKTTLTIAGISLTLMEKNSAYISV